PVGCYTGTNSGPSGLGKGVGSGADGTTTGAGTGSEADGTIVDNTYSEVERCHGRGE
ncbi:hypothetical protein KI387_012527, partial [Taxus chinensis]